MNSSTITVHWHDENQPVYSVDFQPTKSGKVEASPRLVTGGGDNNVRIWKLNKDEKASIQYLSTLRKHTQAVNVVRFDPTGDMLATAGDDGTLILWTLSDHIVKEFGVEDDEEAKESWVVKQIFRNSTSEIYDLSWSPDSKHIATGSMDNITRIYDVTSGQQVCQMAEHNHYVQGISWDPRNEFLATQSADRSVLVYSLKHNDYSNLASTLHYKFSKANFPVSTFSLENERDKSKSGEGSVGNNGISDKENKNNSTSAASIPPSNNNEIPVMSNSPKGDRVSASLEFSSAVKPSIKKKTVTLYHSETLQSFFRRLAFSPDGALLLTPSGIYRTSPDVNDDSSNEDEKMSNEHLANTVYYYIRAGLNKSPVCHTPGLRKPAIVIKFSTLIYRLSPNKTPLFKLPYKMVFAVATQDSIIIHDTESAEPLGMASNLHYSTITDLAWDKDGRTIIVSSADGFCSRIAFDENIFGDILNTSQEATSLWASKIEGSEIDQTATQQQATDEKEEDVKPFSNKEDQYKSPEHASINQLIAKCNSNSGADSNSSASTSSVVTTDEIITVNDTTEDPEPSTPSGLDISDVNDKEEQGKKKRRIIPTLITK